MMSYRTMTLKEAKDLIAYYDNLPEDEFQHQIERWRNHRIDDLDESYSDLRKIIVETFDAAGGLQNLGNKKLFTLDLLVGLKLYSYLSAENGFTLVEANNDDIWRYLSMRVFPDITYLRYPKPKKGDIRLAKKRFCSHTRRIWLKTLWWYVHLSWQGTEEATRKVLEGNGTDTIGHLIERAGKGYRLDLFREIMRQYSFQEQRSSKEFKRMAKLNLAKCEGVEPGLSDGGVTGYTTALFKEIAETSDK